MGVGHRPPAEIKPGELAIQCPAYPHPEVNLPDDWQNDPDQCAPLSPSADLSGETHRRCLRYKYRRSIVLDGNFSAQHRGMKHPEEDVRLADGEVFMVKSGPYKQHLQSAVEFKEVGLIPPMCFADPH